MFKNVTDTFSFFIVLLLITWSAISCQPNRDTERHAVMGEGEGIAIDGSWARPAAEGRMSAGYFLITNYEDEDDTLNGVSSAAAALTEIHESYEREEGMMGMREVPELTIPAHSTVAFEPGGLHVMFIQVTETIEEGDEVELTLHFANHGNITVNIPVKN